MINKTDHACQCGCSPNIQSMYAFGKTHTHKEETQMNIGHRQKGQFGAFWGVKQNA